MKRFFLLTILIAASTICAYPQAKVEQKHNKPRSVADLLTEYEKQGWEAVKSKDYKFFADYYPDDFHGKFPGAST